VRHNHWKQLQEQMFQQRPNQAAHQHHQDLTFVPAESGNPSDPRVEAKQSWELQRRHAVMVADHGNEEPADSVLDDDDETLLLLMSQWIEILHRIAHTVCRVLKFPEHVLLCDPGGSDSIDLLRLFQYDAVAAAHGDKGDSSVLGSSPHTDWGSWTVVWQDDCADDCLETYCHACNRWNPVHPATPPDKAQFIVHVGDATSLALGRAAAFQNCDDEAVTATFEGESATTSWPSPRHRVVSPSQSKRHSLVYFAYPRPDSTLDSVASSLVE